ncbi:MAG: hypothetical protein K6G88_04190 [Lachnospiraceae bacterium]|nr:hypothetical protein [Lachnospiraceae bacterium]
MENNPDSKKTVDENVKSFMMMSGVTGSFLEGYVIGETANCKGVSTVSVITEAKRRGIDVVALSKENKEKLSSLKIEKSIKGEIEKALDNGKIVIVPEKNMYYYDWYGTGYVILNSQTGEAAYMISAGPKPNDSIIEEPIEEIIDDVVEPEVPKGGNIGVDLFWEEVAGKYGTEFAKEIEAFGKDGRILIETYEEAGRINEIIEIINNLPESDRAEAVQLMIDYLDDAVELLKDGKSVVDVKNYYEYPNFGLSFDEVKYIKETVINYGQHLKDMGYSTDKLGPAVAGEYNKQTGEIYLAINDSEGKLPTIMSDFIKERIEGMPPEVKASYIRTRGAGTHAEIYAVNELLLKNPNVDIEDIIVYVNRTLGSSKPVTELPFETCPHCRYILDGLKIISNK